MSKVQAHLPKTKEEFDFALMRCATVYLSESVRRALDGVWKVTRAEGSPGVWEPHIQLGNGRLISPALEYVVEFVQVPRPPSLLRFYLAEIGPPRTRRAFNGPPDSGDLEM
jgi:hypothetical protein